MDFLDYICICRSNYYSYQMSTTRYGKNESDEMRYQNMAFKSELMQIFSFPADKRNLTITDSNRLSISIFAKFCTVMLVA